jgi:hypothetical protein
MGFQVDFPVTRQVIDELDEPVQKMAALLPPPLQEPVPGGFRWRHPVRTAEVVQVAKAVRMVTGIRAALRLADEGWTTECCTLLRTVSDFASEILFLDEGLLEDRFVASQQKFIDQFFVPLPADPDELAEREREYYVGRRDILAAEKRMAEKTGGDPREIARLVKFLNKGYDSYVHGAYGTAMELFTGDGYRFMLRGNESPRARFFAKAAVAGKLHEVVAALEMMAGTRRLADLVSSLRGMRMRLWECEEQGGSRAAP